MSLIEQLHILPALMVLVGFVLLVKGADFLIEGASSIAKRLRMPDLVIGLTIVAFGTSAPELVVCIIAAIRESGGISAGNIIGSNIANLGLILGAAGIIVPLSMQKITLRRDIPFLLGSTLILCLLICGNAIQHAGTGSDNKIIALTQWQAIGLAVLMVIYLFLMFRTAGKGIFEDELEAVEKVRSPLIACIMVFGGLIGLMAGGKLIVDGCIETARSLGVTEAMIGLTIVALGTSLPELATALVAVKKNKPDIAVGNVIGSNIFNTCLVLGVTGIIRPISSVQSFRIDILVLLGATIILILFMFTGKKNRLDRWEAAVLVLVYLGYISYVIIRG